MKPVIRLCERYHHKTCALTSSPVAVFEAAYQNEPYAFLYESLENSGERGRYSFLGGRPQLVLHGTKEIVHQLHRGTWFSQKEKPLHVLQDILNSVVDSPSMPMFSGGMVGYLAYDAVRFFEQIPDTNEDTFNIPEIMFMIPSEIIIFDHLKEKVDIIMFCDSTPRLDQLRDLVEYSRETPFQAIESSTIQFQTRISENNYRSMVKKAQEYIRCGDIFQVVLSQRMAFPLDKDPYKLYRALRITNPSPYMYYMKSNDFYILGSSPETLVKLNNRRVTSRPIAGTRPRGATSQQDLQLDHELKHDEKELAEHIMLVDLARNDLGRICNYGSVQVNELLITEKYSKVMHLCSSVTGTLVEGKNGFDVLQATFPAGTVSGAPKIRAMEIIDELEPEKRGVYGGAIGYLGFDGSMDMCIAIRTIVIKGNSGYIQGGAGIVADSVPEREYHETLSKMSALKKAVEIAP
jgi:anthranilate synthase component 1